jgi:hypothetical protein
VKPSTEALLLAIDLVIQASCERRSDLPNDLIKKINYLKADILYLKEIDCE